MNRTPFARAIAMMGQIAAALAAHPMPGVNQQLALQQIGPYQSHGKGGKHPRRSVGTRAYQRAALKKRNRSR